MSCKDIINTKIETHSKETEWFEVIIKEIDVIDLRILNVNWTVQEVINKKGIGITMEDLNIIK